MTLKLLFYPKAETHKFLLQPIIFDKRKFDLIINYHPTVIISIIINYLNHSCLIMIDPNFMVIQLLASKIIKF
jgi:hypothetical protein